MRERTRVGSGAPHFGHGGAGFVEDERYSSKRSSHFSHRYSYTGMDSESNAVERLRELAEAQGVSPSDDDLEAVQDFVERILPALEEIERRLPPETPA
jgi:hypothetical protein